MPIVSNDEAHDEELEYMYSKTISETVGLDKAEFKQNKMFGTSVTYIMKNSQGEKVERNFNDFALLRKAFAHNFPGLYIPKIPEKRIGTDKPLDDKTENLELRKSQLDDFTSKLASVSHLVSSDIYLAFMKSKANVNQTLK